LISWKNIFGEKSDGGLCRLGRRGQSGHMSYLHQGHLFPLPQPRHFEVTWHQRRVMDWVAYHGDHAVIFPPTLSRRSLRLLVERGLVQCNGHAPAVFSLTEIGRMVRLGGNKGY
jgi:hypothetical protein